jgi:hypothetical protein
LNSDWKQATTLLIETLSNQSSGSTIGLDTPCLGFCSLSLSPFFFFFVVLAALLMFMSRKFSSYEAKKKQT